MDPYVAQIMVVGFNFAPYDFALCNGAILQIAQYTALYSLVGTVYGGNGTSTFGLPNLQSHSVVGVGQGPGLANYALGQVFGTDNVTLTLNQIPYHTHFAQVAAAKDKELAPTQNAYLGESATPGKAFSNVAASNTNFAPNLVQATGGSIPHNNDQPSLGLNYIIALNGIYPQRN